MLVLQILALFLSRLFAKRKLKMKGKIKWLSLVDIIFVQETLDPIYWAAWIVWCFYWDVYDREYYGWAGLMGMVITCIRSYWCLKEHLYVYIPCIVSSGVLTYAGFYNYLELH